MFKTAGGMRSKLQEAARSVARFGSLPSSSGRQARSVLETSKDSKEVNCKTCNHDKRHNCSHCFGKHDISGGECLDH